MIQQQYQWDASHPQCGFADQRRQDVQEAIDRRNQAFDRTDDLLSLNPAKPLIDA